MNYTSQVRKDIKKECKARVREHLGRCIGIQFLYMVPYILLTVIMYVAMFGKVLSLVMAGYTDERMLGFAVMDSMNTVWLIVLIMLIINGPLMYGVMKFYIGLRRGEEPHVGILFKPFTSGRSLWNGIKMEFCLFFRGLLWLIAPTVIFVIVVFAVAFGSVMAGGEPSMGLIIALEIIFMIAVIPISIKLMTYNAGWVVINDNEEYGVWAATRDGSSVFKGHYGKVFVFALSFFGWYALLYAVTYLCIFLGLFGLLEIGGGTGAAVLVLSVIASLCVDILLGAFLSGYVNASFVGLYEYFAQPSRPQAFESCAAPQAAYYTASAVEQPAAEPQPEQPDDSERTEGAPSDAGSDNGGAPAE